MQHATGNRSVSGLKIVPEYALAEKISHSGSMSQSVPADYPNAGYSDKNLGKQQAVEEKICKYQSTNREKALKRELKRLHDFHSFLVSHIDRIG